MPVGDPAATRQLPFGSCCQRWRASWWPLRKQVKSVRSISGNDVSICSSGRDAYTSFYCSCLIGWGRQERRMRAVRVAGSSTLSGWVYTALCLAWRSASSLNGKQLWPGSHTIGIDFDIVGITAASCSSMTDILTELVLLTAFTIDLQSQMMIAEAHDEMEDSHWMDFLGRLSLPRRSYYGR